MNDPLILFYTVSNLFLLIFTSYIFVRLSGGLMKKSEFIAFRAHVGCFMINLVLTTLWALNDHGTISLPRTLFYVMIIVAQVSLCFSAFAFAAYTLIRFDLPVARSAKFNLILIIPFAAVFMLFMVSIFTGIMFTITPDNVFSPGKVYYVLGVGSMTYFLLIIGVSIRRAVVSKSVSVRRDARTMAITSAIIIIWTVLDSIIQVVTKQRYSLLPFAMFASIFFTFCTIQQLSINTDALTKMNNRRRYEEFVSSQSESFSEEAPLFMFICDVNSFKQINDKYGHAEGDRALILLADVIKGAVSERSGFAARYGGDEFVWTAVNVDPEDLVSDIRSRLKEACLLAKTPYTISISCGYVRCSDPKTAVGAYMKAADEMLYVNKEKYHAKA